MRRTILIATFVVSCLTSLTTATNPSLTAQDDFTLVKVADGIFAATAKTGGLASGNAGFVVGDGGVLVFDTFFTPAAMQELIGVIEGETKQPIRFAVDSHYHLDHTGGNQVFAARNVPIIAHDNVFTWQTTKNRRFLPPPEELQKRRDDAAKQLNETPEDQKDKRTQLQRQIQRFDVMLQIKLTNPSVTFSAGTTHLYLGTREVVLFTARPYRRRRVGLCARRQRDVHRRHGLGEDASQSGRRHRE